ncbi:MAG TPA: PfkB family carbohydrate kinase, partial [Thalassobaculum sp.]
MILVLGSINADLLFAVDRLPMRGETVLTPTVTVRPGGKGANQAAAAARAGTPTAFLGCVGDDG